MLPADGHSYWLQQVVKVSDKVDAAVMEAGKEAVLWQIATDKKYGKQIIALDDFLSQTTPEDVTAVAGTLKGGGADGAKSKKPSASQAAASKRKAEARAAASTTAGFGGGGDGGGGARSKPKAGKSKRKR